VLLLCEIVPVNELETVDIIGQSFVFDVYFFREYISFVGRDIQNLKYFNLQCYSKMRWARHVARMGEEGGACRVLVGKPDGMRPLERPRC
jgi:hypothetical protein